MHLEEIFDWYIISILKITSYIIIIIKSLCINIDGTPNVFVLGLLAEPGFRNYIKAIFNYYYYYIYHQHDYYNAAIHLTIF